MNILALDTSADALSLALYCDGKVLQHHQTLPRAQAQHLLPGVDQLLAEAGLSKAALDGIAVGRGPGTFTGVRIAVASAQAMALGLDIPLAPVSTLMALARSGWRCHGASQVVAAMDARMQELYWGIYRFDDTGRGQAQQEEVVDSAEQVPCPEGEDWHIVGTAWATYADALQRRMPALRPFAELTQVQAYDIAELAALDFSRLAGAPELAKPVYLRNKVADIPRR